MRNLHERWYKTTLPDGITGVEHPVNFQSALEIFKNVIREESSREIARIERSGARLDEQTIIDAINRQLEGDNLTHHANELKKKYIKVFNEHKKMVDLRRQEDWSNSWDHFKTLAYRTATAIMVGLVVLCVSYVANKLGIEVLRVTTF
jgi:hypothetical protein